MLSNLYSDNLEQGLAVTNNCIVGTDAIYQATAARSNVEISHKNLTTLYW